MSALGIYFGPKVISLVETKNKKIVNHVQIPNSAYSALGSESKVPEEIKIVAVFKEILRKNKIESKEVTVALSGKDLIIRTFGIPILPPNELAGAINFEAKKYIPFKIEELVSDFQTHLDKINKSYSVLFVGIKKEILEKYFSILNQLDIKIISIEYSPFSILRLIELTGLKGKGVIGVIDIDAHEGDGADFTVMENGFPLFSCDIKFTSSQQDFSNPAAGGQDVPSTDKLKSEIRISLDYYNHKFPLKKIKQMFLVGSSEYLPNIEAFMQELNLSFCYIDPTRAISGKQPPFTLSFLKAYCGSLSRSIKNSVTINILSAWEKSKRMKAAVEHPSRVFLLLLSGFKLNPAMVLLSLVICFSGIAYGITQKTPLKKELQQIIASRPVVKSVKGEASLEELKNTESQHTSNINVVENLLKHQIYLTPQLSALPTLMPNGVWLDSLAVTVSDKGAEFTMNGCVYLNSSNKESDAVNNLLFSMKKNEGFKYVKVIEIVSIDTIVIAGKSVTRFAISGHN